MAQTNYLRVWVVVALAVTLAAGLLALDPVKAL
jgi:hypothetical protein